MSLFKHNIVTKIIIILIIVLFILAPSYSTIKNHEENTDYIIPVVVKFMNITDDAKIIYSDEVNYTFNESTEDVYYNFKLKDNQTIDNISVETPGYYNNVKITNNTTDVIFDVELFSDESKTQKISNKTVKVIYNYEISNKIVIYNDIAIFNHSLSDNTNKNIYKLETYITFPDTKENIQVFNSPPYKISSTSWVNKYRLETRYKQINHDEDIFQEITIPKNYFKNNVTIDENFKETIKEKQNDYLNNLNLNNKIGYATIVVSIILMIVPLIIGYSYVKGENKIFTGRYDEKLLNKLSYIEFSMLINNKIGQINENAFYATILSIINKGFIDINNNHLNIQNNDIKQLDSHEKEVLEYLKDNIKTINNLNIDKKQLNKFYNKWSQNIVEKSIDKYFTTKISKLFKNYTIITTIYVLITTILINTLKPQVPIFTWTYKTIIILIPLIILSYILSKKIKYTLTKEAKKHYHNSKEYETYLNDYSRLIENPPTTPNQWAKSVIYMAAAGDDLSFRQNMIRYLKNNNMEHIINDNKLLKYIYYDDKRSLFLF